MHVSTGQPDGTWRMWQDQVVALGPGKDFFLRDIRIFSRDYISQPALLLGVVT